MMAPIRTLIVDDEPPARLWLRTLCGKVGGIEVLGECANVEQAVHALRTHAPDLLLLDIQLGARSGFQVLDGLGFGDVPQVVFVTAHDQYAIRAFERRAIDYLLKPVREDRFRETIARVRLSLQHGAVAASSAGIPEVVGPLDRSLLAAHGRGYATRLVAERAQAYRVIDCARVVLLESEGNYVCVVEQGEDARASLRGTLQSVATVLDPADFLRINRSAIVNLAHVERIERDAEGRLVFLLRGVGRGLRVGRSYHARVLERMKP